MILSKEDTFEWADAITTTRVSTHKYDLGANLRDLGLTDLWIVGRVHTSFTADGSATLACSLIDDSVPGLDDTPAVLHTLMAATGKATLVAGYEMFKTKLPVGKITQRYFGVSWTVATGPMTAGKVDCFLADNIGQRIAFPRGYVNY